MKLKYYLALSVSLVCVFLAGCGKNENIPVNNDIKNKAVTSETGITSQSSADVSGKVTSAVTKKKDAEQTAVSETKAENAVTAAENKDENSDNNDSQPADQSPAADDQHNDQPSHDEPAQQAPSKQASFDESDFTFSYNGHSIAVGEGLNGFTDSVAPDSHSTAASCLGNGEDLVYTYPSFTINAYKSSDTVTITSIYFTGEEVSTTKNIKINSSVSDLVGAYGDGYQKRNSDYVYSIGNKSISFTVSGDKVTCISYDYEI